MANREEATAAIYGLVQSFLNKNRGRFNGFMRLSNEIDRFTSLRAGLQSLVVRQLQAASGTTGDKAAAFASLTAVPGAASNSKRNATAIKTAIAAIDGSLAVIDDLITSEYADSHPNLVKEYNKNRCVAESGV